MTRAPAPFDTGRIARRVAWRDLVPMRVADGLVECLHPLPWLLASWALAANGWWLAAAPCAFMFFLTALRLNHEAIHRHLGFGPRGHRIVLHALSLLMLGSNHAVAHNHLHHHARIGRPDDVEGKCGRMSGWRVLLYGPLFPVEMHHAAWTVGKPALRRRMRIDAMLNLFLPAIAVTSGAGFLLFHLMLMLIAQSLTAFFAVWITHHDCDDAGLIARTQRSRLVNRLSYNMFLHLEHHLFPAVPVKRLDRLAVRLDAAIPEFGRRARRVLDIPRVARRRRLEAPVLEGPGVAKRRRREASPIHPFHPSATVKAEAPMT